MAFPCFAADHSGDYYYDEQGRKMRVGFDPGSRLSFRVGWDGDWKLGNASAGSHAASLGTGLSFRHGCESGREDCWKSWHHILDVDYLPGVEGDNGWPSLRALLFAGNYVRYLSSPYLTLTSSPGRKLHMPFNFGFSVKGAGVEVPMNVEVPGWDLQVVDARLLFDFWRNPALGSAFQLGIGVRYNMFIMEADEGYRVEHILSPFTAASLLFRHESADGQHGISVGVDAYPFWSSDRGWAMGLDAQTRYELIVLAINDHPLSLFASAEYRYQSISFDSNRAHNEFKIAAGLGFSFQL